MDARTQRRMITRGRIDMMRFGRIGATLARKPRNSVCDEKTGVSVLDVFQSANVLLNKHYEFCCSHPEQFPIFHEMYTEARSYLLPYLTEAMKGLWAYGVGRWVPLFPVLKRILHSYNESK